MAASEEAAIPLPNEDTTPPVMKMNLDIYTLSMRREIRLSDGRTT
jgi:hypothetical protein